MTVQVLLDNDVYKHLSEEAQSRYFDPCDINGLLREFFNVGKTKRIYGIHLAYNHFALDAYNSAYMDRRGISYMTPKCYPAVLFDRYGYMWLNSEQSLQSLKDRGEVRENSKYILFKPRLSKLSDYHKCKHDHAELN